MNITALAIAAFVLGSPIHSIGGDRNPIAAANLIRVAEDTREPSPEEKMRARFPQPVKVGHLIGLPVLDGEDRTLGYVEDVVRTADGRIRLIVPYSSWLGWPRNVGPLQRLRRPVAVPIEVVTILARQIDAVDMDRPEFDKAPTWTAKGETPIPRDDTIQIALGRR